MNRPRMGAGHRKERNASRKSKPESRRESRVQQVNYSLSVGTRRRRKNTRPSRRFPRGRVSCLCFTICRHPFLVLSTNFNAARTLWRNVILPTVEYRCRRRTYAKLGLTDRLIRRVKTRRRLRVSRTSHALSVINVVTVGVKTESRDTSCGTINAFRRVRVSFASRTREREKLHVCRRSGNRLYRKK